MSSYKTLLTTCNIVSQPFLDPRPLSPKLLSDPLGTSLGPPGICGLVVEKHWPAQCCFKPEFRIGTVCQLIQQAHTKKRKVATLLVQLGDHELASGD
jgi:hypothetical protein